MGGRGGRSHRASGGGNTAISDFLKGAYGDRHADAVMRILSNAPEHIQEMWREFATAFQAGRLPSGSDRAYYSPRDDRVYLDIQRVAAGSSIATPYSVLFHEYGHMADYLMGRKDAHSRYGGYAQLYAGVGADGKPVFRHGSSGGLLGRTAKEELEGHIRRIQDRNPTMTRRQAARELVREANSKYSMRDRGDISDIMEGSGIGIAYPLGAGHGLSYWNGIGNSTEIFAEITAAEAAHPGSLRAIREYFPNTYKVYLDMMKARRKR